jgi:catechol 2,3-dioxygenase-like lactoylglutathione lyase family enzyme
MLGHKNALATVAVKDLEVARKFYENKLGLKVAGPTGPEVLTFESGTSKILVYKSQFAGTNQATAVTWVVGEEIDAIVRDLQAKGVAFEKYDFPGVTHEGDVHVFGPMRNAWFKDPDGNILSVVNG